MPVITASSVIIAHVGTAINSVVTLGLAASYLLLVNLQCVAICHIELGSQKSAEVFI